MHESATLHCKAEGNPPPTYTWTPCDTEQVCDKSTLVISKVLNDANYTCKVANEFGSDLKNASVLIGGNVINITTVITSESCTDGKYNQQSSLLAKLEEVVNIVIIQYGSILFLLFSSSTYHSCWHAV